MIETVLGQIQAEELGVTMCHEHLAMNLSKVRGDEDSIFQDRQLILQELYKVKELGCEAMIEVTSEDMGRNIADLQYYSEKTGIHIIASTGGYLKPYHTKWMLEATTEEIKTYFVKELTQGIDNSQIKAGLIGEIATSSARIHDCEKKIFQAAGQASYLTNCAVSTHCDMAKYGKEQIELLINEGTKPEKIILGHIDLSDDVTYQKTLLKTGANIAFDTIGKTTYLSDEKRALNLTELLKEGYENQIVLSQDVSRISYITSDSGMGYTAVLSKFIPMIQELGITKNQIRKMLVKNPSRILNK